MIPNKRSGVLFVFALAAALEHPVMAHNGLHACARDCGQCTVAICGDGNCAVTGEECGVCPIDCPQCTPACGDGSCDAFRDETCSNCSEDCGRCDAASSCGDGVCSLAHAERCRSDLDAVIGEGNCSDGKDNDDDHLTDCDDPDCAPSAKCATDTPADAGSEHISIGDDTGGCSAVPGSPGSPWILLAAVARWRRLARRSSAEEQPSASRTLARQNRQR